MKDYTSLYGLSVAVLYTLRLYDIAHRHISLVKPMDTMSESIIASHSTYHRNRHRYLSSNHTNHYSHANTSTPIHQLPHSNSSVTYAGDRMHHLNITHDATLHARTHKSYHTLIREVEAVLVHSAGRDEEVLVRHLPQWIRALNISSHIDFADKPMGTNGNNDTLTNGTSNIVFNTTSSTAHGRHSTMQPSSKPSFASTSIQDQLLTERSSHQNEISLDEYEDEDEEEDENESVLNKTTRSLRQAYRFDPTSNRPNQCRAYDIPLIFLPQLLPGNISLFKHRPPMPQLSPSALRTYKFPMNTHAAGNHSTGAVLMPRLGFGMKAFGPEETERVASLAIKIGFRRFETSEHFGK